MTSVADHFKALRASIMAAAEARDKTSMLAYAAQFRELARETERAFSLYTDPTSDVSVDTRGTQSRQFMIDLLPYIQRYLRTNPRGTVFDVLDVGPGSGLGTAMLANLFLSSRLGYRMRVSAIDLFPTWSVYMAAFVPNVRMIVGDIFKLQETFDIVVCSHVIEHVQEYPAFVDRLQKIARKRVFLCAPFEETPLVTKGHINSIDRNFLRNLDVVSEPVLINSAAWGWFDDPRQQMFVAELNGRA